MPRPPPTSIRRGSSACSSQNSPEPAHHALEHAGIVDLRAEVDVQAAPVEVRVLARLDAGPRGLGRREAELGAGVRGRDLRVARRRRCPASRAPRPAGAGRGARPRRRRARPRRGASSTTRPQPAATAASMSASVLPLPCTTMPRRIDARAQRRGELAGAGDVGAEAALAEQPQHADRAAGLAGERDVGVRMARHAVDVGLRALAQRGGVVDVERRAEALARAPRPRRRRSGARRPWLSAVAGQGEPSAVTNAPRRASPRCAT